MIRKYYPQCALKQAFGAIGLLGNIENRMSATLETPSVKDLTLAQLADEYAEVRLRMMAWKPNVNPDAQRFGELAEELLSRHVDEAAEKQIQVQGERFVVPISPRQNKSSIVDRLALYKRIRRLVGVEKMVEYYSITLTAARKLLSKTEQAKYIREERTGRREIGEPVMKAGTAA